MSNLVNKEELLLQWCQTNPFLADDDILFNFLRSEEGMSAIVPIAETVAEDYNDGAKLIYYDFMWQVMFGVSKEEDNKNTGSMYELRKWQNWIDEQNKSGNLPDFGNGYDMFEVHNLTGMPNLAQTYENSKGKYQFPARLIYMQN